MTVDDSDPVEERRVRLVVDSPAAGIRIDAWLADEFPEESRSSLKRLIKSGRVRIDGEPTKPSHALRAGETLEIEFPPPPSPTPLPQDIPLDVLYEDDCLLVINKPAGLVVHPSPGVVEGGTIVNALLGYTEDLSQEGGEFRPGIVHRLDKDTSGALLVAKTDAVHRKLAAQFKARTVSKTYYALSHGIPRSTTGLIDLAIGRSLTHRKKMAIRTDEAAKSSRTTYRAVGTLGADMTWFRCHPETGRTHQIRLHLKAIGHPILCDALYGREKQLTEAQVRGRKPVAGEPAVLTRHALHAAILEFDHPGTGERRRFASPLPADLALLWSWSEVCESFPTK